MRAKQQGDAKAKVVIVVVFVLAVAAFLSFSQKEDARQVAPASNSATVESIEPHRYGPNPASSSASAISHSSSNQDGIDAAAKETKVVKGSTTSESRDDEELDGHGSPGRDAVREKRGGHTMRLAPWDLSARDEQGVKLVAGFDCSPKNTKISVIGPAHFSVKFPGGGRDAVGFFLFRLENAKGKEVTIDLENIPDKWRTLNPVVCDSDDLTNLSSFESFLVTDPVKPAAASNGPLLPDTSGEQWHFITDVTHDKGRKRLRLKHGFHSNAVTIAMRPPFTPGYLGNYVDSLREREHVTVHEIGETPGGRPLYVIQVGGEDDETSRKNPCVLIYAREHPDEHDGSWVAQGAIEYMLLDERAARRLRRTLTLLVIPIFDPDGAVDARYHRIVDLFQQGREVPETDAYMGFLVNWFNAGRRIDLMVSLHNVESAEAPHISCGSIPRRPEHLTNSMRHLHEFVHARMQAANFESSRRVWGPNYYFLRLCGMAYDRFRVPWVLYEVNSQAPKRHLNLADQRILGAMLLEALADHVHSGEFQPLIRQARQRRIERLRRWVCWNPEFDLRKWDDTIYGVERRVWLNGDPEDFRGLGCYENYIAELKTKFPELMPR